MPKYLDPKADIVFKKVFGERSHLLKSFLNALLPLADDAQIESLEYLPAEQVPVIPCLKRTIVDVKCTDQKGRIFIVEMQMDWVPEFKQWMLFNSASAYVKQFQKGEEYKALCPVYGLGIIADLFDPDPFWYHHYRIVYWEGFKNRNMPRKRLAFGSGEADAEAAQLQEVGQCRRIQRQGLSDAGRTDFRITSGINVQNPQKRLEGLELIFLELPKFKPSTRDEKYLRVLWLRFLSELSETTKEPDQELLAVPEIREAIGLSEEATYSTGELEAYSRYWDEVSTSKTLMSSHHAKGLTEGLTKEREEGLTEGYLSAQRACAKNLLALAMTPEAVAEATTLPLMEIEELKSEIPASTSTF